MAEWDVKLQHLKDYGDEMVQAGQTFDRQADGQTRALKTAAEAIAADPRFTELAALKAGTAQDAGQLGAFTDDMGEAIQSHGVVARESHRLYGGADSSSSDELEASLTKMIDLHTKMP